MKWNFYWLNCTSFPTFTFSKCIEIFAKKNLSNSHQNSLTIAFPLTICSLFIAHFCVLFHKMHKFVCFAVIWEFINKLHKLMILIVPLDGELWRGGTNLNVLLLFSGGWGNKSVKLKVSPKQDKTRQNIPKKNVLQPHYLCFPNQPKRKIAIPPFKGKIWKAISSCSQSIPSSTDVKLIMRKILFLIISKNMKKKIV